MKGEEKSGGGEREGGDRYVGIQGREGRGDGPTKDAERKRETTKSRQRERIRDVHKKRRAIKERKQKKNRGEF